MKICYIPTFYLPWCATSWRRALEFGKVVSKHHQLTFMCPDNAVEKLRAATTEVNIKIIPVNFKNKGYISKAIARILALENFDIIHTFKPMSDIFPAGFAGKFKGAIWIADLDDLEGSEGFNRNSPLWKRKLMDFFEWLVPACADAVTVASQGLKQYYNKFNPLYIPNGADPDIFKPLQHSNDKPVMLFMGRFHRDIIDADVIINAISKVSEKHDIRLLMIGDGDEKPRIEELADKLNIDAQFTGHIDNVPEVIAKADIGVISFRDNMLNKCKCPLRLYEYMACGLPIVSTKVGEPGYALKEKAGLLVEANTDSIAEGIMTLLKDKELVNKLGNEGRKLILKEYNWNILGRKLIKFYDEKLNAKKY